MGCGMVEAVLQILKSERHRLAELDADTSLVHGDFNPTNILIRDGMVSGVLDWEYCHVGTPYMDIGNLLRQTTEKITVESNPVFRRRGYTCPKTGESEPSWSIYPATWNS